MKDGSVGVHPELVPLDVSLVADAGGDPEISPSPFAMLPGDGSAYRPEVVYPSDVLSVTIFEVGVTLFGPQATSLAQAGTPTAGGQTIAGVRVDDQGVIDLPYVGTLAVVGLTPREIAQKIEQRLSGLSQSPQAVVSVVSSVKSAVSVMGAVAHSGRYPLTVARERVRDMIAVAGGIAADPEDIVVRLTRQERTVEMRLSDIKAGSADDAYLAAGDQLELLRRPRTFTVFGAADRVSQVPFGADKVNLLEAIARAGGPSDSRANPRGVFLFRWENGTGTEPKPVIYRLDMMQAGSYFVASQFAVHDKDVLYFANSASNPPTKFISIINQLFSPFVTAKALTQ
ncbi:polysaccharide biosynthesis/export family protein [Novosphingobium album (ex Hu et al. 2023)]|uniref:Polysaccharide export protein n=1 Tax=Novosphingobium album (ex Hu et al. 2023) TaxID=2930093 RepID=A0ABT0B695_9SPHN|nr:polysaccharide biosynthesis/export family protein [Novosphingobium album (ex Hu et al. 2023)]MCJ2180607.1 polysaccharide export protein [Novosphingobium album (ex Hu et al. 2023)]